jgi:hypothetical protein
MTIDLNEADASAPGRVLQQFQSGLYRKPRRKKLTASGRSA